MARSVRMADMSYVIRFPYQRGSIVSNERGNLQAAVRKTTTTPPPLGFALMTLRPRFFRPDLSSSILSLIAQADLIGAAPPPGTYLPAGVAGAFDSDPAGG